MATYTPNLILEKPDSSDAFGDFRESYNDNMDKIDAGIGSGGGHIIIDPNGTQMAREAGLQFTGGVTVTDDNVNGVTIVDVTGGGGNVYGAFIDTNRIITSGTYSSSNPLNYTATEDCFVSVAFISSDGTKEVKGYIDGVYIYRVFDSNPVTTEVCTQVIPLKKGQTLRVETSRPDNASAYTVYGITQGTSGIFAPVIYSDTERVIGVWRDNKPLYQITIDIAPLPNNTTKEIQLDADIERVISMRGYGIDSNDKWDVFFNDVVPTNVTGSIRVFFNTTTKKLYINTGENLTSYTEAYVTIQYTKTTDTAGSGNWNTDGIPTHHYSTNEQVIGTWIDGKPLYEKTWDFSGSPISLVYNAWVDSGIESSTNIDTLVNSVLRYGGLNCMAVEVGKGAGGFTVGLNKLENLNTRGVTQITLQYTKTTD